MATTLLKKESASKPKSLSKAESALIDAYWRAANYLSVGQIYLFDNPLLRETLKEEHIKPRLLGHWGTTPGLNFIYAHLNRLIKKLDLDMRVMVTSSLRYETRWEEAEAVRLALTGVVWRAQGLSFTVSPEASSVEGIRICASLAPQPTRARRAGARRPELAGRRSSCGRRV